MLQAKCQDQDTMAHRNDSDDERFRLPAPAGARSPRKPSFSYSRLREDEVECQRKVTATRKQVARDTHERDLVNYHELLPSWHGRTSEEEGYSLQSPARARRDGRLAYVDIWERLLTPPRSPSIERSLSENERHMDEMRRSLRDQIVDLEVLHRLNMEESSPLPPPSRSPARNLSPPKLQPSWYRKPDDRSLPPQPAWCVEDSDSSSDESLSDEDEYSEAPNVAAPVTTPRTSPARAEASTKTPDSQEVGPDQGQSRHRRDQSQQTGFREAATQTDPDEGPEQGQPHHQDQLQPAGLQEVLTTIELLRARVEVAEQRVDKREY